MDDTFWKAVPSGVYIVLGLAALFTVYRIAARIIAEVGRIRVAKWTGEDPDLRLNTWVARGKPVTPKPIQSVGDDGLDTPTTAFNQVTPKRPRLLRDADGWK